MLVNILLNRLSSDITPVFLESACIRHRQKKFACSVCMDVCPTGAVKDSGAIIDARKCNGCGVCVAACPTRALSPATRIDSYFNRAVTVTPCIMGCSKGTADITVACLAGLPWEFYASLAVRCKNSNITLDLSHCLSCEKRQVLWVLFRNLRKVRNFLGDETYNRTIRLIYQERAGQQTVLSRREIFGRLGTATREFGQDATDELFIHQGNALTSPYRKLLWQTVNKSRHANCTWPVWQVDEKCVLCGSCRALCPQNAWEVRNTGSTASLLFYPRRCTECTLCVKSCPQDAKYPGKRVVATPKNPLLQKLKQQTVCSRCHKPHTGTTALCVSCGRREELRKELVARTV